MDDSYLLTFCNQCKIDLQNKLRDIPEKPILVIPPYYNHVLARVLTRNFLNDKFQEIRYLNNFQLTEEPLNMIVMIPNEPEFMKSAINIFKIAPNATRNVFIFPRYGILCEREVQKSKMESSITITELYFDLIPLESYHYIIPTMNFFRRVFLEEEYEPLTSIARGITKIEMLAGIFPQIISVGSISPKIQNLLQENRAKIGLSAFNVTPTYSKLILIDRMTDILTPLLTEFTYGAVIDAFVDSTAGIFELPDSIPYKGREIILSDADEVFKETRTQALPKAAVIVQEKITDIAKTKEGLQPGMDTSSFKKQALKADHLAKINKHSLSSLSILSTFDFRIFSQNSKPFLAKYEIMSSSLKLHKCDEMYIIHSFIVIESFPKTEISYF